MNALSLDPSARQLRGKAFFHAATQAAGCPHQANSMAKCWQRWYPRNPTDSRSMWRRASHGATLMTATRNKLYRRIPTLRSVFDNPLWAVLSGSAAMGRWDELAETIRVGNQPLDAYDGKLSRWLFDRVDWPCFAVHLVLLHTRDLRFLTHRMWLARNLTAMYALSSVQSPLINICSELYSVLWPHVLDVHAPCDPVKEWWRWPERHRFNAAVVGQLCDDGWLSGQDQLLALLLWNLWKELRGHFAEVGLHEPGAPGTPMPVTLRRKWTRKIKEWQDHPVSLNGYCCEFPQAHGLTLSS
ncbi:hypothetical protein [Pseudomonas sp. LjRoot263]|uniref:hypothetical protein n=1 Tax=Pseudomonas sp. LjRoot263 TaxID=3342302 RepID=UPI003ECE5A94